MASPPHVIKVESPCPTSIKCICNLELSGRVFSVDGFPDNVERNTPTAETTAKADRNTFLIFIINLPCFFYSFSL